MNKTVGISMCERIIVEGGAISGYGDSLLIDC